MYCKYRRQSTVTGEKENIVVWLDCRERVRIVENVCERVKRRNIRFFPVNIIALFRFCELVGFAEGGVQRLR